MRIFASLFFVYLHNSVIDLRSGNVICTPSYRINMPKFSSMHLIALPLGILTILAHHPSVVRFSNCLVFFTPHQHFPFAINLRFWKYIRTDTKKRQPPEKLSLYRLLKQRVYRVAGFRSLLLPLFLKLAAALRYDFYQIVDFPD